MRNVNTITLNHIEKHVVKQLSIVKKMWKRGSRNSALDRAQALLSSNRNSSEYFESMRGFTAKTHVRTGAVGVSALPNTHALLSDLSDLSSVSSSPERGADIMGSAAAGKTQGGGDRVTKDIRPQSSLGGGGSRFLKKAPPPPIKSTQSPTSKRQVQQEPEPRNISSTLRGSQTAALHRLAQIESRIRSHKQTGQGPRPAENLNSNLGMSPPSAVQSLEASVQLSAQSSSDHSLRGKRFLKKNTSVNVTSSTAVARSPDVGFKPKSRAADRVVPSVGLGTKSVRVISGVSLESDEEDMRKLLGDSLDSMDNSFSKPERPSSIRPTNKVMKKSGQKVHSPPPPAAAVSPSLSSTTAPPCSPNSPSRHGSPFRFTGNAQAHFSPSVLSPSPSPPCVSLSPLEREISPHSVGSPQHSISSMSGHCEVLSLEELFPAGPGSEDHHSQTSAASSEDFKINVMTLDDLVPANLGFTEKTPRKEPKQSEVKLSNHVPGSLHNPQLPILKEKEKEKQQEEEYMLDYQSDFESDSRTESDYSASQVSEHLQEHKDEEEVVSEVREEASDSHKSGEREVDDYSSTVSDPSHSDSSRTSDHSQTLSGGRESRSHISSRSSGSSVSNRVSRRPASTRKVLKEAAAQTQPDPLAYTRPADMATLGPAVGLARTYPTPVVTHTLNAEMVEALSTFNPAAFALDELLKQQLAMTRRFIERNRHLHSSLMKSLEPPNYRYTTLEDTQKYIRRHRSPKLTMEEALEDVMQQMRDNHHF